MADLVDTRGKLSFIVETPHPAETVKCPTGSATKRVLDVILAIFGVLLLSPLFLICYTATVLSSPGPALFRHRRVGFNGETFACLKFRTMVPDAAERLQRLLDSDAAAAAEWNAARKLRCDPRVTAIGALMRKSSLDELPQLFNVLRGDMSIVGPRPVTEEELVRYEHNVGAYLSCRPGITGLWQVSGRSTTTYGRRVACDTYYARNWSIVLDTKIMLATIPALFEDGAY
ncbi:sugar transferase [Bradyrhizobium sp. CB2312]|uniref:sugar transferase n=1 Tax=Bradyrhizobium sp. CB2312 TaxID=3039155 RepID=UPI0024B1ABB0|nr:sugar transferase [Bradyrhizobium sp. CB2312]WFU69236.1 sugar transferase [Bradyrhizobium sp. CB2312]